MELKQLRFFITVAEELNFHRAAERLFISQPPLSRQIKMLEESLGVLLFHRIKKRVTLTEAGEALMPEARAILAMTEMAKQKVLDVGNGESGTLNISFVISGMMKFLPTYIKEYKQLRPKVNIVLSETAGTSNIVENLVTKKTDISFTYGVPRDERIISKTVYSENILYALPTNHPSTAFEHIRLKDMKNTDFIFFPRELDTRWYDRFQQVCKMSGFVPRIAHHAHPMQNRLNMVAMGLGVTFVAESLIANKPPGVEFRYPHEDERLMMSVTVSYRKDLNKVLVHDFLKRFDLIVEAG